MIMCGKIEDRIVQLGLQSGAKIYLRIRNMTEQQGNRADFIQHWNVYYAR